MAWWCLLIHFCGVNKILWQKSTVQMSVLLYSQNNKQTEMRIRAAKSMQFMQKVFGLSMVFFVVVLYFIWLLTGMCYINNSIKKFSKTNCANELHIIVLSRRVRALARPLWNIFSDTISGYLNTQYSTASTNANFRNILFSADCPVRFPLYNDGYIYLEYLKNCFSSLL